jgi:atypical dual specificity phosphatase
VDGGEPLPKLGRTGRIYRGVRSKLVDSPTFFSWVVRGKLAASGMPFSKAQVRWLSKRGIDTILSLTEKPLPAEWFEGSKISSRHIPMRDHDPPDVDRLIEASRFIESEINSGRSVVVHCLAGKGRTGSAIAAYLVATSGMNARSAIDHLRKLRPGSVESRQVDSVLEFEKRIRSAGSRPQ